LDQWTSGLWLANIVLLVILAGKLVQSGLFLRYKAFFFLVCFLAARNSVIELLSGKLEPSFWFWLATEPILVLSFIVAVIETYALALNHYRSLRTFSSHVLGWSIVIASVISVLSILPDLQFNAEPENAMFLLTNVVRRGIYTSLLAFLSLLLVGITIYPVKMSRNAVIHCILFSVLFFSYAATILGMNFKGYDFVEVVNSVFAVVDSVVFVLWIVLLSPAGETVQRSVRANLSEEEAARMMKVIQRMNDAIADTSKRL
jgi:hypothetical protein